MSQWLTYATDLVAVRKPAQLAQCFVETITRELGLASAMLLMPSSDGRTLVPHDKNLPFAWPVTDFDSPFAHVLQSAKSMQITADELVFWRSNRQFYQLTATVGMFDSVWIEPLPIGGKSVQTILFMIGESHQLANVFKDEAFRRYLGVYSNQWTLLMDIEREEKRQKQLRESLCDIEKDNHNRSLQSHLSRTLIGQSAVMSKLRDQIVNAASSQLSVMVQGETGTGKELVAQAVHDLSSRSSKPFVAINCAAIPENLLESELFGHTKGAFSGADSDKQGLIAQANGGTLFLDEIGDMPLQLQAKLLRVLETRSFRPVGGKQEQLSDFRLVSATHVNLLSQVRSKAFRQDLYYRLFQYPITLPRLAARIEDLDGLSQHFVALFNLHHNTNIRGIHYKALDCLKQHDFPGNVRELKHLIEFGCAQASDGEQVMADCFAQRLAQMNMACCAEMPASSPSTDVVGNYAVSAASNEADYSVINDLKQAINEFESRVISERLMTFSGDRAKAAESLGIPKRTLAYKCQKLEIKTS
jgi:sigma-54 dependent transcriptional regulator